MLYCIWYINEWQSAYVCIRYWAVYHIPFDECTALIPNRIAAHQNTPKRMPAFGLLHDVHAYSSPLFSISYLSFSINNTKMNEICI